ncbi:hypothetical protein Mapa_002687 [Marchantia paleacea]|nr:hypothetical protein Mapa_002687 [Marchantia paleacea]
MAPSHSYHEDYMYLNELAVDRTSRHRPWTSNPILSALVFIAIGTTLVFYIQARSLTRKMRPSVAGVPTRLPATVVWGLFSLQHSQISHVHAETVQTDSGVVLFSLGCSQFYPGVPYDVHIFESLRDPDTSVTRDQHANASLILSEIDNFRSSQQMEVFNEEMSAWKDKEFQAYYDQRAVDLKYAKMTAYKPGQTCFNSQGLHMQGEQDTNRRFSWRSRLYQKVSCSRA